MEYNLFIKTKMASKNLWGVDEEQLQVIVDAYLEGEKSFTIGGEKHWLQGLHKLLIYTHETDSSPHEFMNYMWAQNKQEYNRFGSNIYFPPSILALAGNNVTSDFLGNEDYGAKVSPQKNDKPKPQKGLSNEKVFIVHGQDDLAKVEVARFVSKLGFEPIILHEQISSGKTIIEKIEEYSNVGFGIVLYTPCDIGSKDVKPFKFKLRARQNVVFEHGYLIGKIGRNKICALVKGDIETPNDISGVVYVTMDNANAWQIQVAKELKGAGYKVDLNKLI